MTVPRFIESPIKNIRLQRVFRNASVRWLAAMELKVASINGT
jgi:hypothetical protein